MTFTRMCSVLEFLGMERDGSVLSTCFCVRLSPPDGTKSSHRREYSAQMRDGVIRPNRPDDAEPSRKNHRSHLTLALPSFSRASPSRRPAAALPPIALSLSGAALPPIALSLSGGLSGAALPRLGGGGGCYEARRGRRLLRGRRGRRLLRGRRGRRRARQGRRRFEGQAGKHHRRAR
jgi:hypothetical protein